MSSGFSLKRFYLETIGKVIPSDVFSARHVVSVKGIFFIDNKVILLKNERDEWDLPGGKLKRNENIQECLQREMEEELNIVVQVDKLLDVTKLTIMNTIDVLVMVFLCSTDCSIQQLKISVENFGVDCFDPTLLKELKMEPVYKQMIQKAFLEQQMLERSGSL